MLTWTEHPDGWRANGFTIRLVEPFRWVLTRTEVDGGSVRVPPEPLAVGRTLTECKREAELLVGASKRSGLRRRWAVQGMVALAALVFATDLSVPWDIVIVSSLGVFALRCVSLIAGSFYAGHNYSYRDFFYQ